MTQQMILSRGWAVGPVTYKTADFVGLENIHHVKSQAISPPQQIQTPNAVKEQIQIQKLMIAVMMFQTILIVDLGAMLVVYKTADTVDQVYTKK